MKFLIEHLLFDYEKYEKVKEEIGRDNWKNCRVFSGLSLFMFAAVFLLSFWAQVLSENRTLYLVLAILSGVYLLISHVAYQSEKKWQPLIVYLFYAMMLSYGVALGTVVSPNKQTLGYIIFMIMVPLLFTTKSLTMNGVTVLSFLIYIPLARYHQPHDIFVENMINIIIYGALSLVVTAYSMRKKVNSTYLKFQNQYLEKVEQDNKNRIQDFENFITDMIRYAASEQEPEDILNQILQYMGEKLHSDRAYIFEDNGDGTYDNTYEWCREGVSHEIDNLKKVPYEGMLEVWFTQYKMSHNILIYDLEEYRKVSEPIYEILKPQGINTLVTGPIIIEGKMMGFYGVDNPPKDSMDNVSELIGMMEFIIAMMIRLRDNADSLRKSATHDQLTGCKNRNALQWVYSGKYNQEEAFAVLMCDLNGLKAVNDKQGHDAGDKFILRIAEVLKSIFGEETVYRMGGDEFIAIQRGISKESFEEKMELAKLQLGTTASMGAAYTEKMDTDFEVLLKQADQEMYAKKNAYYEGLRVRKNQA